MQDHETLLVGTTAADQMTLRRSNLALVLRSLRDAGPRSRARLAADLGLNKATVSSLVAELTDRGLVREGQVERGGIGRPGLTVELAGQSVCGIGAEVNVHHVATLALDLGGAVVSEHRRSLDTASLDAGVVLDHLADLVTRTADDVAAHGARPIALTVGIAGLVDAERAVLTTGPNLGWRDVPVARMLRDRLGSTDSGGYPIVIDNEANLAAIAEATPGDASRRDMLVIFGEVGVGGGIIADGHLLRGHQGYAGEFGHMIVDPTGHRCGCGRTGCWETVVGLRALLDAAADPDDPVRDPRLGLEDRLAEINRRASLGDTRTLAALERVGDWVGVGAGVLTNALNPGVIVLSGYFAEVGSWMRAAIERRLHDAVLAPHAGGTRVELSTQGFTAAVRGAATVALESVFHDPTRVERRVGSSIGGTP
ncbi:ROK family transcriptional regulator [Nocardioides iriomotensis]|nr:ROK family transcriptional regulator [Nocardioides iriomotensis]